MNKKLNTILFILGETLFNIIVAMVSGFIFILFYAKFLNQLIPPGGQSWAFFLIFISSLAVSFFVYRYALKYLMTKVDIEKYFDPLFVRKYQKKNQ
jgi:hypothetical protein